MREGGISPNGYELLAIRFAFLKQTLLRANPSADGWSEIDSTDSVTEAHLEGLRRAARVIDMGQRTQELEGGLDLQPQRGGEDADLDVEGLCRVLQWEGRRGYLAFPTWGTMLVWAHEARSRSLLGRPVDFIGTVVSPLPEVERTAMQDDLGNGEDRGWPRRDPPPGCPRRSPRRKPARFL